MLIGYVELDVGEKGVDGGFSLVRLFKNELIFFKGREFFLFVLDIVEEVDVYLLLIE